MSTIVCAVRLRFRQIDFTITICMKGIEQPIHTDWMTNTPGIVWALAARYSETLYQMKIRFSYDKKIRSVYWLSICALNVHSKCD